MRRLSGIATLVAVLGAGMAFAQDLGTPPTVPQSAAPPGPATVSPLVVETPTPSHGQPGPAILTIDQDELFSASLWGKRIHTLVEEQTVKIADENERLATQFSNEEEQLTTLRDTLAPDEFRKRAEEFDKRVVEVRRQRDSVGRELQEQIDQERASFFRLALPVLAQVMRERGAIVVLDQRSIFVSAQSIDITDTMIKRIDAEIGAGPAPDEPEKAPQAPTPAPQPKP